MQEPYVVAFETLGMNDVEHVGGKNASLGEMISHLTAKGVRVPTGVATTAHAFRHFLATNALPTRIAQALQGLNVDDVATLTRVGQQIRQWVLDAPLPPELDAALRTAYADLTQGQPVAVAVRSSATAEDLPDASFAGQQETLLNVRGIDAVLIATKQVYASLYNDRAIAYRVHQGFEHADVALSVGIQRMVESTVSGVMFTLDTESGFRDVVFVTASYGLGEMVVQGAVNPDEFYVHKPTLAAGRPPLLRRNLGSKALEMVYDAAGGTRTIDVAADRRAKFCLTDAEVVALAQQAVVIEQHYGRPMDIEWGKDAHDGQLYILQSRPETVKSRAKAQSVERYQLKTKGEVLASGRSIGQRIGQGVARVLHRPEEMLKVQPGDVIVADMTDPDWEPVMKKASAIVTNRGGRTCHAAIIARELGVPAVVGTNDATRRLRDGQPITVSCAEGDTGFVYDGLLNYDVVATTLTDLPPLPFKIMMNVGNPERAFDFCQLPNAGVGLARLEFIINKMIGIHPKALLEFEQQTREVQDTIRERIAGYDSPVDFFVKRLSEGVATLAAAFWPQPVIVRLSDFKSNEYANLIGGPRYEPHEENPMLGYRGASRYISPSFRDCFALECAAMKYVRELMGLTNVQLMIPFVRTVGEAEQVIALLAEQGLKRGDQGLKVVMMCELPSNALLADEFLNHFDGFSIGSNDLTQLTLGLDRDSGLIAHLFDERNPAVKALLSLAIQACKRRDKYVGICGQGPSDHPDLAKWLMEQGIDSVSLNPDTVIDTWLYLAKP